MKRKKNSSSLRKDKVLSHGKIDFLMVFKNWYAKAYDPSYYIFQAFYSRSWYAKTNNAQKNEVFHWAFIK